MALAMADANRAVASALQAQHLIANIAWSQDKENLTNNLLTNKAVCPSKPKAGALSARPRPTRRPTVKDMEQFSVASMPELDGEEQGNVPVYDTCDDVRNKINAHLSQSGVTQAAFCRELSKLRCLSSDGDLQSAQLTRFLRYKGVMAGNTSKAFYTAYVYCEKLRLKEGEKKSKKREEMERIWARKGGVDTTSLSGNVHLFCWADAPTWGWTKYGVPEHKRRPSGKSSRVRMGIEKRRAR